MAINTNHNIDRLTPSLGTTEIDGNLSLLAQKELRLSDSDSSNYVALKSPATVSANRNYILPATIGSAGDALKIASGATATDATLEWGAVSGGSGGVTDGDKGDITVSASGATWTIDAGVVSNSKLANVSTATFKGRTTAGTGAPEDLTTTQATALLDTFTSTLKGLTPSSGGGTTNFLRADGTWTAPPGEVTLAGNNAFTGANTFTNTTGQTIRSLAGSDGVIIKGSVIGSSSFAVTLQPASNLTSNTTLTIPNVSGALVTTGDSATVTNSMLANMTALTIKGRLTGTGSPENLTTAQATSILDTFTSSAQGLAPSSGGGTTNFLRADGTWAAPPSSGGGVTDGDKGDITVSASGATWTIDAGVVSNSKLANVSTATFKGRTTAGTGAPEDLSTTQATALLDTFSSSLKGLTPSSGGGTTNFLRADGTWAAPSGGGTSAPQYGIIIASTYGMFMP